MNLFAANEETKIRVSSVHRFKFRNISQYDLATTNILEVTLNRALLRMIKELNKTSDTVRFSLTVNHPALSDPIYFGFRKFNQNNGRAILNEIAIVQQSKKSLLKLADGFNMRMVVF